MCNKPVMNAIKGGFGIFSMNAGRMLPPILMVGGMYFVWALVEPMASVGILSIAVSLFFVLCIAAVHVEFIQSLMNDQDPSLNPIKMIYRMEVVKLFVTKLVASIVIVMILTAVFVGLMMLLGMMGEHFIEMKVLISWVILLFAGFFMYAKIAYLPIQISLENKASMREVFEKSKN